MGEFAGYVDRLAAALAAPPDEPVRQSLVAYVALVASWNRKLNLTGASEPSALCEVLLADAFVLQDRALVPEAARIVDVGSGAGATIVPLALLRPDLHVLCVEPRAKRATFLRTASARLGLLPRVRVREARVDPSAPAALGEAFDLASSRATFEPALWLELGLGLAARVLVMTGSAEPPPAPEGAEQLLTRAYALPLSHAERKLALYRRV